MHRILVLNAGSSSLKYALFNSVQNQIESICATGVIEHIGQTKQTVKHKYFHDNDKNKDGSIKQNVLKVEKENLNHKDALGVCLSLLSETTTSVETTFTNNSGISAVGHRVVHGGEKLSTPQLIDDVIIRDIREASTLAPLHNPANLQGIETALEVFPSNVKHVAVFDTSFHSTIPAYAYLYALPHECYTKYGVRRYGFHGTSHEYVMKEAAKFLNKPIDSMNVISCHIGAGASVCCIKNGRSVDTSMGFTPLEGLVMATRSGDVDASVVFYLMKRMNLTVTQVESLLVHQSGWYGLTGTKHARDIELDKESGNEMAALTTDIIAHRIRKYIGAYFWNLGGNVDAIIFTAGLGENWSDLRQCCLEDCENFGIEIDSVRNKNTVGKNTVTEISSCQSKVSVLVVPTDEEYNIAHKTLELINQ